MNAEFAPDKFLNLACTEHPDLFGNLETVWQALPKIASYLEKILQPANHGSISGNVWVGEKVFIGEGTTIEHGACIKGPAWIGPGCQIRTGAYIRENVIVGGGSVIGNSCELKNSVIFQKAEIPHFNYVGDSILGYRAHIGAGVICSNVRLDRSEIFVRVGDHSIATGLRKFGAVIGDHTEVGCNSVLSPGSVLGRNCIVYPGSQWRGVLPGGTVARFRQEFSILPNRKVAG